MEISKEKVVTIHYTLKNDNGEVIDSSEGQAPMPYLQGFGNIIPGLEHVLEGKSAGDKIDVSIPPEEAYGKRNEEFIQKVELSQFEEKDKVQVGVQFQVQSDQGVQIATITEVEGEQVTIDLNHPLADETLHFNVEVVEVRDAAEEELSHGHVHGSGGHHH